MAGSIDVAIVGEVGRIYNAIVSERQKHDYVVNPGQMNKFLKLVRFFEDQLKSRRNSRIEVENPDPRMTTGSVTAKFILLDVHGDKVREFCEVLSACSVVQVMYGNGNVMLSCTVPEVFVRKDN